MEIVLVRHGEPVANENKKVTAGGFTHWIQQYNKSFVVSHSSPDKKNIPNITHHYVVSSPLRRAVHSAKILTNNVPDEQLNVLKEMDIPRYKIPLTLKAWTWVYLCRLLWMCGIKGNFETFKEAKQRAELATLSLISMANNQQKILAVGHGVMNLYIRKNLKKRGWRLTEKSSKYWGVTRLEKTQ